MCEQAKSGAVARRRGVKREANLPACGGSLTSEKKSPLYGANTAGIHFGNVNNCVVLLIDQLTKTFADSMTISEPLERDGRARSLWTQENGTAPSGNKLEDISDSTFWNKACHFHVRVRVPREPSSVVLASDTIYKGS
jgi:hypothetical protein